MAQRRQLIFTDFFRFSNWLSSRTAEALGRLIRPPGASTRRRPGSGRRMSDCPLEPARVRVQKGSFCTTLSSSWCALAGRCARQEAP
eukprot:6202714-Pleurochrysis_carterae.AAC.1